MAKLNEDNIIYDGTKKVSIDGVDVYTSREVDNKLIVKADSQDVYNKKEIEDKLKLKVDQNELSNYATKSELRTKVDDIVIGNLGNTGFNNNSSVEEVLIEVKQELDRKQERNDSSNIKNDISKINTIIGNIRQTGFAGNTISEQLREVKVIFDGNRYTRNSSNIDLSNYYTKSEVYNKEEVDQKITHVATGGSVDLSNYATKQELDAKADVTSLSSKLDTSVYESDKDAFATKSELNLKADNTSINTINQRISTIEGNLSTKADNTDYQATKRTLTTLNSKVGELTSLNTTNKNDLVGAINELAARPTGGGGSASVDLSNYYTKAESDRKYALSSDLSNKVDSSVIGDLQNTGLTGSTVTELLTDVKTKIDAIPSTGGTSQDSRIGELADLTTTEKSTIVGAINELAARPSSGTSTSVDLADYYNKEEVEELIYNECDTQFNEAVFKYREKIDGLDDAIKNSTVGPVYRIPSLTISKNGTIHVVCDARGDGGDQGRNEIVYARSVDGGKTWSKQVIGHRYKGSGYSEANSRVMDPTILDAGDGLIFVLAGRWITGSVNWTGGSHGTGTCNNWSASLLMKSTDDGRTWSQHTIGKADCTSQEGTHITVDNLRSGCKGFLGGINPGFRHSSGKLVFQIQFTTGSGDAKSTLLTSDDNGASWRMAGGDTGGTNYECSMIELPDGRIVLHTRSEDTDSVVDGKSMKKAFVTSDFGETWSVYSPLNRKIGSKTGSGSGHRCEGGTIGSTTISGNYICAAAYPQVTADSELGHTDNWSRNQITLYACNLTSETVTPIQMIQYRSGLTPTTSGSGSSTSGTPFGGYSSLMYKQTDDGEYFVTVFEDELGISTRNLSHLLPRLELYSGITGVKTQVLNETRSQIMTEVNTKTNDWPDDFTSFIDTHTIPENKTFNVIGSDLTKIGSLSVGGGFLNSDGNIDNTKLSLSPLAPGLLHIVCTDTSDGSVIRGNVSIDSNATVLSVAMTFCQPTTSLTVDDYQPLVRFYSDAVSVSGNDNKGGLEIKADGTLYVTKANMAGTLMKDKIYNIVAEYDSAGVKVYLDGELLTNQSNSSLLTYIKSATYMCIGAQGNGGGSESVKRIDMHIGNIAIYSRQLTYEEKKNVRWINGIRSGLNAYNRINDLTSKVKELSNRLESFTKPNLKILNIVGSNLQDGAIGTGDIDVSPYSLGVKIRNSNDNGFDDLNSISSISSLSNTSIGINDGGIYIGQSKKGLVFNLGTNALSTNDFWTIKARIKLASNVSQWKTLLFLIQTENIGGITSNSEYYKGGSNTGNLRLETSTGNGSARLQVYSGLNGNGSTIAAPGDIGDYANGEEFTITITCDRENIIFFGKKTIVAKILKNSNYNIIGFNGGGFGSFYVKDLQIIKGKLTFADEI